MKNTIWLALFCLGTSASALAASPAVECFLNAPKELNKVGAMELCAGATSRAPIECYRKTKKTILNVVGRIELCTGATTLGPVTCFLEADESTNLDMEQKLQLCKRAN